MATASNGVEQRTGRLEGLSLVVVELPLSRVALSRVEEGRFVVRGRSQERFAGTHSMALIRAGAPDCHDSVCGLLPLLKPALVVAVLDQVGNGEALADLRSRIRRLAQAPHELEIEALGLEHVQGATTGCLEILRVEEAFGDLAEIDDGHGRSFRLGWRGRRLRPADKGQEEVVDDLDEGLIGDRRPVHDHVVMHEVERQRRDPGAEPTRVDLTVLNGALEDDLHGG